MRRALLLAVAVLALLPAAASAHAELEGSFPARGTVVRTAPASVVLRFSEAVESAFGAIRVYDARTGRVDDGDVVHPGGRGSQLAVGLRGGLAAGSYTVTYRVISADGHPVSGGLVFSVGRAGAAAPVGELLQSASAGEVTRVAQRVSGALQYLATALGAGLVLFWLWCRPAVRDDRMRALLLAAAGLGLAASVAGVVLQGAVAAGTDAWGALDPRTIGDVLGTRWGTVWGLRSLVWLVLGGAVLLGVGLRALAAPALALVAAPAFEGHSATLSPAGLLVPLDVLHVAAMAVWLGGIAGLLLVVPHERAHLRSALARFSPLALAAVVALATTGTVASVAFLTRVSQLWGTGYGRELLAKIALLAVLVGLGAVNRRRMRAGRSVRDVLRAEVALLLAVLTISAVLVEGTPPVAAAPGPFSASQRLGPLDLELTVEPARPGANTMHLYLFAVRDGAPFTASRELTVTAALPGRAIGPLPVTLHPSGPGHFTADRVELGARGDWRLVVTDRVSDFDEYSATIELPIR